MSKTREMKGLSTREETWKTWRALLKIHNQSSLIFCSVSLSLDTYNARGARPQEKQRETEL